MNVMLMLFYTASTSGDCNETPLPISNQNQNIRILKMLNVSKSVHLWKINRKFCITRIFSAMISKVLKATIKIYFEKNNLPLRRHLALNRGLSQLKGIKEKEGRFYQGDISFFENCTSNSACKSLKKSNFENFYSRIFFFL